MNSDHDVRLADEPGILDAARVAVLRQAEILDTESEEAFDRLTRMASRVLHVPVAIISLVDDARQFFKSQVGLPEPWASQRQTPLSHSFCKHVVSSRRPLIVADAREHPLVSDNPAVEELGVIAYAGVPLTSPERHVFGAFCAIDSQPREWSENDLSILADLATTTMKEVELRLAVRSLKAQALANKTEKTLRELLLQSMDRGVYGLDRAGRCTFINAAAAAALGYTVEEILGRDMHSLIHYARLDGSHYPKHCCPVLSASEIRSVSRGDDEVYWRKDGSSFPIEYVAAPLIENDTVEGIVVTFDDITSRKEMLRRIAVQHAVSSVLAQATSFKDAALPLLEAIGVTLEWQAGSIWQIDEAENVLRTIATWEAHSLPVPQFRAATESCLFPIGKGLPGRVWQTRQPVWIADILSERGFARAPMAAADGLRSAICFPLISGGEVAGVLEFFSKHFHPPDDELLRTVATTGRQIGEFVARKKAEEAWQIGEARKAAIFSAALDAIISIDARGQVLEWNPAAERIFGYQREDVLGREMAQFIIPAEFQQRHREGMRNYLANGEGPVLNQRIEITAKRSDGTRFPVELAITRDQTRGSPTFLGFVRDITARKQAEQDLCESERFARNVIDALSAEIAILDERGTILDVNQSWLDFARKNRSGTQAVVGVGANYLDVCDRAATVDSSTAEFAKGIRAVIAGEQLLFEKEYPCHAVGERRWFVARVTRFTGEGPIRVVIAHENITKRKLAELEQERLSRYNQMLLDSTGEGIYGVDTEGNCTFINRAASQLLDLEHGAALGRNMHELTHHSRSDGTPYPISQCPIDGAYRTGEGAKISGEAFWRPNGSSFPVEYSSFPLCQEEQICGAVVVFSDIAQRLLSEQQLTLLSLVASKTDNAIIITDRNGVIEWVNEGFSRITGYSSLEAIGRKPGQLLQGPLTDAETVRRIRSQLEHKTSFTEEILNYRKDGRSYWLSLSITPVLDGIGEVDKYIAIESDITERKLEEQRREEQMRLSALIAEVGTAITQSDVLSVMLHRCTEALVRHLDGAFARIWTLNASDNTLELQASAGMYTHLDGEHSRIPFGKFKIGLIAQERKPHLTNSVIGDERVGNQDWAKQEGMVAFAGYPLIVGDEVMGVAGMFARHPLSGTTLQAMAAVADGIALGIQRLKAAEELKKSKEAADEANQAKSQFLANMSHELRTPLNAVIMYSELLMEEADDLGGAGFLPDLEKIRNAGQHLLGLINNVLDLSKIEAGRMDVYVEEFDVASIVDELAATIRPLVDKNSNKLILRCQPDIGLMRSDLTKVRQILFNLLSNASKFTNRGDIVLDVCREECESTAFVVFHVHDSGIGMTDHQREQLFQSFSQADASTTRKYGGTGLGLAITKRLCHMLGGSIDVQSKTGEGSTFIVRVPLRHAGDTANGVEQVVEVPHIEDEGKYAGTVLVIDDDPAIQDMMTRFLRKEQFRAVLAGSAEEGLRRAHEILPDIIILDVMMPRTDGWAVLKALKADPELAAVPVIMLTVVDDRNLGYLLGASEYVTKPFDRAQLGALLEKHRPKESRPQILVAEDDEETRQMLKTALEDQGWLVVEAENGRAALERLAEVQPDVILLDLLMPEMNGFEFAAELRRSEAWRRIPVVVITATDLSLQDRTRLHGTVHKVLRKDAYRPAELLQEIRSLMKNRKLLGSSN